jgi:hypothetical protein
MYVPLDTYTYYMLTMQYNHDGMGDERTRTTPHDLEQDPWVIRLRTYCRWGDEIN